MRDFHMHLVKRRILTWSFRALLALLALACLYLTVLLYPGPLFAHEADFGAYHVYSDRPMPADVDQIVEDTARRIQAMEHAPPDGTQRVYLCNSPSRYAFFASLTRKTPDSLAIGLSIANETFVSMSRVRLFAATNHGVLRHTRFEGSLSEVIAHEIAHFNSAKALGYRAHLAQPVWKSEGWAEYQANIAFIRADPDYNLARRIDVLLDDEYWGGPPGIAREMWKWQLLVEFLGEIEHFNLEDLVSAEVTEVSATRQMMRWHARQ